MAEPTQLNMDLEGPIAKPTDKRLEKPSETKKTPPAESPRKPSGKETTIGDIAKGIRPRGGKILELIPTILVGFPHPINFAMDLRVEGTFGVGIGLGKASYTLASAQPPLTLGSSNLEARIRWFPFEGAFFLGGILGWQKLSTAASNNIRVASTDVPTHLKLTVSGPYITPHLGWIWVIGSGFTLGIEGGIQLPFSQRSNFDATTNETFTPIFDAVKTTEAYHSLEQDLNNAGEKIGEQILPFVTLLRIGWTF